MSPRTPIKAGIVGATGYTGTELLRLLAGHPAAQVVQVTSRAHAGTPVSEIMPQLRGVTTLRFSEYDEAAMAGCDLVFFATPHGAAMGAVPGLLQRGVRVIDLGADFRVTDPQTWERWYGHPHGAPDLLREAVYGLPEINREALRGARLVANPGCYPTAVCLALLPLLEDDLVEREGLIADAKSGVSGAGRALREDLLFCEAADNFKAYGVGGHRHLPEICQVLSAAAGTPVDITFVPHLIPMVRGLHATVYAGVTAPHADLQACFERRYGDEPFVDVLPPGAHPETRGVKGTNLCRIAVHRPGGGRRAVVLSVIDNLVKGAAGQAVQNMNIMFGMEETAGLHGVAMMP